MNPSSGGAGERLRAAVEQLSRAAVLVVGDSMLDRYVYGEVDRVSPEAPVPVLGITREVTLPGGAGNVVRHLGGLGASVAFVSVVGDDQAGSELTGLIGGQPRVEPWLLVEGGRTTTQKSRFIASGQQILRADREDTHPLQPKLAERLVRLARDSILATSITVLSDYRKGVLAADLPAQLLAAARAAGRRVVVGARGPDVGRYAGADVLAATWRGLSRSLGVTVETDASVVRVARDLVQTHKLGAVLIMRSGYGLTLVAGSHSNEVVLHLRSEAVEVLAVGGVGDAIIAVLSAALAAGVDLPTATELSNVAASLAMGRVGTGLIRVRDLMAALSPRGADQDVLDLEEAAERAERWRRVGWRVGLAHGDFREMGPEELKRLEMAHAACDRLIVVVAADRPGRGPRGGSGESSQAVRAARLAALPYVDIVVPADQSRSHAIEVLRPDVLLDVDQPAPLGETAELLRGWGGRVLTPSAGS